MKCWAATHTLHGSHSQTINMSINIFFKKQEINYGHGEATIKHFDMLSSETICPPVELGFGLSLLSKAK